MTKKRKSVKGKGFTGKGTRKKEKDLKTRMRETSKSQKLQSIGIISVLQFFIFHPLLTRLGASAGIPETFVNIMLVFILLITAIGSWVIWKLVILKS